MGTINGHTMTAHQTWCNKIQEKIIKLIYPKRIATGKNAFMTSRAEMHKLTEAVVTAVNDFENTRLRVVADEMIILLDSAKKIVDELKKKHESTYWFLFRRKHRTKSDYLCACSMQQCYQQCIQILVSTFPPEEPVTETKKPEMKINRA